MKRKSVWQSTAKQYPRLEKDLNCETVVIGGGIAGFMTAFKLHECGKQVALIEADRLFCGTTGKTTGKISRNQETIYYDLFLKYGKQTAEKYYLSQAEAQRQFLELLKKYSIDCDLIETDSYIFSDGEARKLKENFKLLKQFGAECEWVDGLPKLKAKHALKMSGEYAFDPLKFLCALPVGFDIYEHTRAVEIDCSAKTVRTENALITAKNIVIATNYPIINAHGGFIFKLRQSQSYLAAVNKRFVNELYLDERKEGLTLRPYAEGTLIGGGDHRTGRVDGIDRLAVINKYATKYFGENSVTAFWCAEDVMTADGMPMAGKYWSGADGIFVLTGFNKWGMTNSMACSSVVCDMITGKDNPYASLFSPQRSIKGAFADYAVNVGTTLKEVVLGYFRITMLTEQSLAKGEGGVVRYKGKKRAVYKDYDGKLYVIGSMCPHMHGELKWNPASDCWECPCHGSRFDKYGNVISGPSTKNCKNNL